MRCPCGYNFARGALAAMADPSSPTHRSYAVVRDADWETMLAAEAKVLQASGERARLAALGDAAQWVGVLLVCPDCGRLGLSHPDFDEIQFFRPDDPAGE
jgi:hypothetical protein